MVKDQLGVIMGDKLRLNKREGVVLVEKIIEEITGILQEYKKLEIRGFGTFRIVRRKPKLGRIISTGETVSVPSKAAPKFIPGKILKELVNRPPSLV